MKTENTPIISIICTAYNHENYIKDALEGFVNQKTNFLFEIIVHDDASTDKTASLIREYEIKYPNLFVAVYQIENQYSKKNGDVGKIVFGLAKGKYIALCEGDDYWTDPLKLQKQVDFLEANPDYAICFHKVNLLQDGIIKEDTITANVPETTTIKDLAKGNYMHTCSVVYRNNLFAELPEYFNKAPVGDYFLHLLNARYGDIKCFDEIMGMYRLHGTSVWSSKTQKEQELLWVPFLENIKPNFDKEVQDILNAQIAFYTKPLEKEKKLWNMRNIKNKIIQKVKRLIQVY